MDNFKTIILKSGHGSVTRGAPMRSSNTIRLWLRKFGALDKSRYLWEPWWSTRGTAGCIIIGGTVCSLYFSNYFRNISCTSLCCKKSQSVCGFVALSSCVLIFAMIFGHDTIHHQQNTEKIQLELNLLTQQGWDGWGREPDNHSRLIFTLFLQPVANWDRNLLNRALTTSV